MFTGAIEQNVRSFIAANAKAFDREMVVVGCSGNFTSEKVLMSAGTPAFVYSNDVSLYSQVLADAMLDQRTPGIAMKDDDAFPFVAAWLNQDDLWFRAASVLVFMRMLEFEKQKNVYQRMQWRRYLSNFPDLVADTATNLKTSAVQIDGYFAGDCFEHYQQYDEHDPVYFGFLPTYAGGYERIYKRLNETIDWPEPTYPMINDERREEIHKWLVERRYLFITDRGIEGLEPVVVSARAHFKTVYIYSNVVGTTALFRKPIVDSGRRFVTIPADYQFTANSEIQIVPIKAVDIAYYKAAFLNPDIDFVVGTFGFALLADGGVFGFVEFSLGKFESNWWYMMADFPIDPKPHKRTSKLVAMLAVCNEVREWLENKRLERSDGVRTTAWTDRPVSMKYRGVLQKTNSGTSDQGKPYVNYQAVWSNRTAQETYTEWRKRHKVQ